MHLIFFLKVLCIPNFCCIFVAEIYAPGNSTYCTTPHSAPQRADELCVGSYHVDVDCPDE